MQKLSIFDFTLLISQNRIIKRPDLKFVNIKQPSLIAPYLAPVMIELMDGDRYRILRRAPHASLLSQTGRRRHLKGRIPS